MHAKFLPCVLQDIVPLTGGHKNAGVKLEKDAKEYLVKNNDKQIVSIVRSVRYAQTVCGDRMREVRAKQRQGKDKGAFSIVHCLA